MQISSGQVEHICGRCARTLLWKKLVAPLLPLSLAGVAIAIAFSSKVPWLIVLPILTVGTLLRGLWYSWGDRVVWGGELAKRWTMTRPQFPVGLGHVFWRCTLCVVALMLCLAFVVSLRE